MGVRPLPGAQGLKGVGPDPLGAHARGGSARMTPWTRPDLALRLGTAVACATIDGRSIAMIATTDVVTKRQSFYVEPSTSRCAWHAQYRDTDSHMDRGMPRARPRGLDFIHFTAPRALLRFLLPPFSCRGSYRVPVQPLRPGRGLAPTSRSMASSSKPLLLPHERFRRLERDDDLRRSLPRL